MSASVENKKEEEFWKLENFSSYLQGFSYGVWYSRFHLVHSFVIIPIGILILFAILYGINVLLVHVIKIKFPASVFGMLVNLGVLCVLNAFGSLGGSSFGKASSFGQKISNGSLWLLENYLMLIKPSMNFTLKWINVFFLPSFVTLPLSDHISFVECAKIAGIFVFGGLGLMLIDVYLILFLRLLLKKLGFYSFSLDKGSANTAIHADESVELQSVTESFISARNDITTIDVSSLRKAQLKPSRNRLMSLTENPFSEAEIDLTPQDPSVALSSSALLNVDSRLLLEQEVEPSTEQKELARLLPTAKVAAIFVVNFIDWFLYLFLFLVSLPFYYVLLIHVMLPYHLGLSILAYYVALLIPQKFPRLQLFAHPILVLTAEILFVCFIGSLIFHKGDPKGFLDDLKYYKTGKTYLNLFNKKALYNNGVSVPAQNQGFTAQPMWPGCGDFLSSLMDISIVSLSLPMFTHRKDFMRNVWVLVPPLLVSVALTFLCYPIACYHMGISPERSIGFIGRLVTLALGTPLILALGGSVSLMAVCTILSGICSVLIYKQFFRLLRVSDDDFITRGVTLGVNGGAIATAHLLTTDPRAALMSSLSFSIFGIIMVILASIGDVQTTIKLFVGM